MDPLHLAKMYFTEECTPTDLSIQQVRHLYSTLQPLNFKDRILYLEDFLNNSGTNNPFVLTTALTQLWFAERCWAGTKPSEVQSLWLQETALIEAFAKYHYLPNSALKALKKEFEVLYDGYEPDLSRLTFAASYLIKTALSPVSTNYNLLKNSGFNIEGVSCPSSYYAVFLKLRHKIRIAVVVGDRSERYALYNGLEETLKTITGVKGYPTKTRLTFLNKSSIQLYGKLADVPRTSYDLLLTLN